MAKRSVWISVLAALAMLVACSDGDDDGAATTAASRSEPTTGTVAPSAAGSSTTTGAPQSTVPEPPPAMTLTVDLAPEAVWEDGTPITVADLNCTWQAMLHTPGSQSTAGYDQITAVRPGVDDKQAVISFSSVFAAYRTLFDRIIKQAAVVNCADLSGEFVSGLPISGRAWKLENWSPDQASLVPNERYWGAAPEIDRVVFVPRPLTQIEAIIADEVDFIYPGYFTGIEEQLVAPNVTVSVQYGGDFEALYMNAQEGRPFGDRAFREAFYKSIDLDELFEQIYAPIAPGRSLLTCGPIVPGPYCPDDVFGDKYDPAGAAQLLEDAGYQREPFGLWTRDGVAPQIRWMVNTGDVRRESTQLYLIPLLREAGFNVIADNCDSICVFEERLPALDYDLRMSIQTGPPDPSSLVANWAADQIPTAENGFTGNNVQGWSNQAATDALHASERLLDEGERAELIKAAIREMDRDYILIPLYQFPKPAAYRSDRLAGVEGQLNNYRAFSDVAVWDDLDGDGQVVIAAENWPECLNPVTECATSVWYRWTVADQTLPAIWDTTNDGGYQHTDLVTAEPTVAVTG